MSACFAIWEAIAWVDVMGKYTLSGLNFDRSFLAMDPSIQRSTIIWVFCRAISSSLSHFNSVLRFQKNKYSNWFCQKNKQLLGFLFKFESFFFSKLYRWSEFIRRKLLKNTIILANSTFPLYSSNMVEVSKKNYYFFP